MKNTDRIIDEIRRSGGEVTFRNLKKSHCFTDFDIREYVGRNLDRLEIFTWQNPAGGPRSERVRLKLKVSGSDRCLVSSLERLAGMDCSCSPIVGSEFCDPCKAAKALNEAEALMESALREIHSANT